MPVYEYVCKECGGRKERNLPMWERDYAAPDCDNPDCDPVPMVRKWGVAGVVIR